jgi:RNA 3'-terminal phosphate cyclase (ATP)
VSTDVLTLDGRMGEGGGQVLRSALSLSVALGRPVRVTHVRGGRAKPGLLRQHVTALRAAAAISGGVAEGGELGSSEVGLRPGPVRAGSYELGIGSAGSTLLVLQTVLTPLLLADGPSTLVLEGGTHNPMAPPFEFLTHSFLPLLARAGVEARLELLRPGFYPAGGGKLCARIAPVAQPRPLELLERGAERAQRCEIGLAHLPATIAEREWDTLQRALGWPRERRIDRDLAASVGPGNVLALHLEFEHVTEVLTAFGERGLSAERLANRLAGEARAYLAHSAPVGEHLADQLMIPLALQAGGRYRTGTPSLHARTNAAVVNLFLPGTIRLEEHGAGGWIVDVQARRAVSAVSSSA